MCRHESHAPRDQVVRGASGLPAAPRTHAGARKIFSRIAPSTAFGARREVPGARDGAAPSAPRRPRR